jgi:hypothetical protein
MCVLRVDVRTTEQTSGADDRFTAEGRHADRIQGRSAPHHLSTGGAARNVVPYRRTTALDGSLLAMPPEIDSLA